MLYKSLKNKVEVVLLASRTQHSNLFIYPPCCMIHLSCN